MTIEKKIGYFNGLGGWTVISSLTDNNVIQAHVEYRGTVDLNWSNNLFLLAPCDSIRSFIIYPLNLPGFLEIPHDTESA